jgi:signal transduction histidine kinase
MTEKAAERFRIDPAVVFKLGQELISDETQALLELIKNSYDADASYAVVRINSREVPDDLLLESEKPEPGFIEIVDDGTGMKADEIRDGWLLIARSLKADFKASGLTTGKERTPLGDKGLGRLGAQRLGWGLQLATKTADNKQELVFAFSWRDFFTARTLDEVDVRSKRRETDKKHGTTVTVTELNDPDRWRGEAAVHLQRELSRVISPYEGVAGFSVTVSIDGEPLDLQSINREVLDTAQLHYEISFDGETLRMEGVATLGLFRPTGGEPRAAFAELVERDGGKEFREQLLSSKGAEDYALKRKRGRWFVGFTRAKKLGDVVDPVDRPAENSEKVDVFYPNPGPFRAVVDSFDLSGGTDERSEVFGGLKPYRKFIKDLAGIRVYRDGFAVRVDRDWLALGGQWTSAGSYYGLKPDTTTGYVALSAKDNPGLIEKTDREGFTDSEEYRSLQALMAEFRGFTEEVQEHLRREFVEYFKAKLEAQAEVEKDATPEGLSEGIEESLEEAKDAKEMIDAAQESLGEAAEAASDVLERGGEDEDPEKRRVALAKAAESLRDAISQNQEVMGEVSEVLGRLESAQARNELVREEVRELRRQLEVGVEAMGLGLTAEALSHEMFNIADGLSSRTQQISRALKDGGAEANEVRRYVEHVRGAIGALRRELGHFAPGMRYVRERRDELDMAAIAEELADYYSKHWAEEKIALRVSDKSRAPFKVKANRGRVNQVFDNLILNSHYWLARAIKAGELDKGVITLRLKGPVVVVSDNGPGIDPSIEATLFEPFTTRKPRGKGRGLGLFIVRQLMEGEGGSVELGPRRNSSHRRYEFLLDFSGVMV